MDDKLDFDDEEVTGDLPRLPSSAEVPERIQRLDVDVRALARSQRRVERKLGVMHVWMVRGALTIVAAIIGASGTFAAALVAYGRLQEQAATNARLLDEVKGEIRSMRVEFVEWNRSRGGN